MNLKRKIRECGFTLEQVRVKMQPEMSQPSMSALVRDDANPTFKKLQQIADIIGISIAELVSDEPLNAPCPLVETVVCPNCGAEIQVQVSRVLIEAVNVILDNASSRKETDYKSN